MLEQQVRRMIAERSSRRSSTTSPVSGWACANCAGSRQTRSFPEFDENLREAFRQETELFLESQIRGDRSIVDLLSANYTFVNERLARHYRIPNMYGNAFRRVTLVR